MIYSAAYAFFDPPLVLDCAVTPIPASTAAPYQLIADSGEFICDGFVFMDTTGDFIGVYTGPAGQERLSCIIGNGRSGTAGGVFPPHSRVSVRALMNVPITAGRLAGAVVAR